MEMPSILEILAEFQTLPPRFLVNFTILRETWEWALDGADVPTAAFSCDETPVLHFIKTRDSGDEDSGPVLETPSGIILYT